MRLYDVNKGTVEVDGLNVKKYNLPWFHKNVTAIVSQEPEMFEGKVSENIGYAAANPTKDEVENAAGLADAHKFISDDSQFPDKYATLVGEKGVKLSGGQK